MNAINNVFVPSEGRPDTVKPFTVLLVDDEALILAFIRIKLQLAGYTVLSAVSASEALHMLRDRAVDIAVIDLMMPGVGGLRLIERMRAFTRIPVIVLTSMDYPDVRRDALSTGADDFLAKPFNPDEIVKRIDRFRYAETIEPGNG